MGELIDIRYLRGFHYKLKLLGLTRTLPLYQLKPDVWLVANEPLSFGCDVEFTKRVANKIVSKLKRFKPKCLLTAEAKATSLVYEVAKGLGHKGYALARKRLKETIAGYISTPVKSITTKEVGQLFLSQLHTQMIKDKDIVLIDDCISTGGTLKALLRLAKKAHARVVAIACIWLEGPWVFQKFKSYLDSGRLIYLDSLPIFAKGRAYEDLLSSKRSVSLRG